MHVIEGEDEKASGDFQARRALVYVGNEGENGAAQTEEGRGTGGYRRTGRADAHPAIILWYFGSTLGV